MADRVRVAVLVSGRGSNMLALSEYKRRDPDRAYEIALVASNVPEARGLVLAKRLGLKTWALSHQGMDRREFDHEGRRGAARARCRAGRARRLHAAALARIRRPLARAGSSTSTRRLLPAHKGLDTHRRALLAGDESAGCSVHLVTDDLDSGPVLAQAKVRILPARRRRQPRRAGARGGAPRSIRVGAGEAGVFALRRRARETRRSLMDEAFRYTSERARGSVPAR